MGEESNKLTSSASGTSLGMAWVSGGEEGAEVSESHGLGTRGLSESDSPNISIKIFEFPSLCC